MCVFTKCPHFSNEMTNIQWHHFHEHRDYRKGTQYNGRLFYHKPPLPQSNTILARKKTIKNAEIFHILKMCHVQNDTIRFVAEMMCFRANPIEA